MDETQNHILQVTDAVSARRFALRLEPGDDALPVRDLLEKYLKRPDLELLLGEGRITKDSAEMLESVQDLVYVSDDSGRLHDMFAGIAFKRGSRTLQPDEAPGGEPVRLGEKDVLLTDLLIDRTNVGYDRNWLGFSRRRWGLGARNSGRLAASWRHGRGCEQGQKERAGQSCRLHLGHRLQAWKEVPSPVGHVSASNCLKRKLDLRPSRPATRPGALSNCVRVTQRACLDWTRRSQSDILMGSKKGLL